MPGLHHVEIYVSDLSNSERFWSWFLNRLGYRLFQSWDNGRSWILDDTYLVFVQVEDRFKDAGYHRCRVGLNHLAFHASSPAQVDEITEELKARGVTILYPEKHPRAGGSYGVFFEDPDRIKVELVVSS